MTESELHRDHDRTDEQSAQHVDDLSGAEREEVLSDEHLENWNTGESEQGPEWVRRRNEGADLPAEPSDEAGA